MIRKTELVTRINSTKTQTSDYQVRALARAAERKSDAKKRPHHTERVERMKNTINKKLTHTFEFGFRYIVMNRFTDRQS